MINLTVIHAKDIIKYFTGLIIILILIFSIYKYFANINSDTNKFNLNINPQIDLSRYNFLMCLESGMPLIKELNKEQNVKENNNFKSFISQKMLGIEIGAIDIVSDEYLEVINEDLPDLTVEDKDELSFSQDTKKEEILTNVATEVIAENNIKTAYTNNYNTVEIKNESDYSLTEEMLIPNINISREKNILIFHTHTCESYTPSDGYNYEMTGNYRTTNLEFNVAKVGSQLKQNLESYGFSVLHNTTYHDYPAYSGSYSRSLVTVENNLVTNPNTEFVIDLHRDALGDNTYAPTVKIGEEYVAQIMFVIGTDGGGLHHPNWINNLKTAVKIQEKANELYPGLFRPIILRNSRYNQHVTQSACILEIGATGNTMEQCLASMKYLSKVIDKAI